MYILPKWNAPNARLYGYVIKELVLTFAISFLANTL